MTEKQAYSYTVLRYVHDVVSGEALNVGVVMHAPAAGFLKVRTRKNVDRLKQAFPNLDRSTFVAAMRAVDRGLAVIAKHARTMSLFGEQSDARSYALKVLPNDDSALQWSPTGTGLADDPDKTFERLYERYVVRYDLGTGKRSTERRKTDEDIWRTVRDKLKKCGLTIPFQPKEVVGDQDQIAFERAWQNGRWHAYEPVSLDLADAEGIKDKARRWRGHLAAAAEGTTEQICLYFVLGRPQNPSLMSAYETAKAILSRARFATDVVDENDVDDLVASMKRASFSH